MGCTEESGIYVSTLLINNTNPYGGCMGKNDFKTVFVCISGLMVEENSDVDILGRRANYNNYF